MGTAVKTACRKSQIERRVSALSSSDANEMKRLCQLYHGALDRADIDQARLLSFAIGDLIDRCGGDDRAHCEELRSLLGFSGGLPSPVLDR